MYGKKVVREFFILGESKLIKSKLKIVFQDHTKKSQPRITSESNLSALKRKAFQWKCWQLLALWPWPRAMGQPVYLRMRTSP